MPIESNLQNCSRRDAVLRELLEALCESNASPHERHAGICTVGFATVQRARDRLQYPFMGDHVMWINMPFRKSNSNVIWHWCRNCSDWPANDFEQREDKPLAWRGDSLCAQCAASDTCCTCQHSVVLWTGLPSDSVLGAIPMTPP